MTRSNEMPDRRSRRSRFYRFFARRGWRWGSFALVVASWTVGLTAGAAAIEPGGVGGISVVLVLSAAITIVLGFFGLLSGVSRWAAEPAAARLIAKHADNPAAHAELAAVRELRTNIRTITDRQFENRERFARIEQSLEDHFDRLQKVVSGPGHSRFVPPGKSS